MSSSHLSRRDFLKLLLLLPLFNPKLSPLVQVADNHSKPENTEVDIPNILIIVFDALSARNMSLYGYQRETTPNISRFANRATVYHRHYSAGNFTTPGTASLLTGTYPWTHRGLHLYDKVTDKYAHRNIFKVFSAIPYYTFTYSHNQLVQALLYQFRENIDELTRTGSLCLVNDRITDKLLPEDFTLAFLSEERIRGYQSRTPNSLFISLLSKFRYLLLEKSISNSYSSRFPRGLPHNYNDQIFILEHAIDWLKDQIQIAPKPVLGYIHFYPPHEPYMTRKEFYGRFVDKYTIPHKPDHFFSDGYPEELLFEYRRHYDEYIAYVDAEFGRLFDFMDKTGFLDNAYIILTTDHGQSFERGILGHLTPTLYEPLIHIPLVVSKPKQQYREDIFELTSSVDVLPTLLHLTKQPIPDWCEGQVLPTFMDFTQNPSRNIFAIEAKKNHKHKPLKNATISLMTEQYKLIYYSGYESFVNKCELYDLQEDPEELYDIYPIKQHLAAQLKSMMMNKLEEVNQPYMK